MAIEQKSGCCSPRTLVAAPMIGVLIAAFAYYYYENSYARFVKVDFNDWALYTQTSLFEPTEERYLLVFYSSNIAEQAQFVQHVPRFSHDKEAKILAIDLAQNKEALSADIVYATAGINTLLHYIHHFKIRQLPTIVAVQRKKNGQAFYQSAPLVEISSAEMMRLAAQK
ncbi:MAG: hypothetical protein K2N69_02235 [Helicobacter sp.]|nr:hypothetical protein [Helicobacter sp.]